MVTAQESANIYNRKLKPGLIPHEKIKVSRTIHLRKALLVQQAAWDANLAKWLHKKNNCGKSRKNYVNIFDEHLVAPENRVKPEESR